MSEISSDGLLSQSRAISSPSTTHLPPEIIAEIAKNVISCSRLLMGSKERLEFKNLRAVNREWRETFLSTPEFWRNLRVCLEDWPVSEDSKVDFVRQVTSWLKRGGEGCPLSLEIIPTNDVNHPITISEIRQVLSWPTLNFSHVKLKSAGKTTLVSDNAALARILSPAPSLAKLELLQLALSRRRVDSSGVELPTMDLDLAFPVLKRLEVFSTRTLPMLFFHRALRELHLDRVDCARSHFVTILQALPSLSTLSMKNCEVPKPRSAPPPIYSHHNLRTVHFSQTFPDGLLPTFACPSLQTLILDVYYRPGSRSEISIHEDTMMLVIVGWDLYQFVRNSCPSNLELCFKGNPPPEFVEETLKVIPLVRTLRVECLSQLLPYDGAGAFPFASTFDEIRSEEKEIGDEEFNAWKEQLSHMWLNQTVDDIKFVFEG